MKEIFDYPNYYLTTDGQVWSKYSKKFLTQSLHKDGYLYVSLNKEGIRKTFAVHRLMALTFLPNPNNYIVINHKNENKQDNRIDNLEWCNQIYNINYGTSLIKRSKSQGKKVRCIETNIIYYSIGEASRQTGIDGSLIQRVCSGKRNHTHNLHWEYVD